MGVYGKLMLVQASLKAPKGQFNSFGKYKYRSAEDILESVKPLLAEQGLLMVITDDVVMVGARTYVKAIVTVTDVDTGESVSNSAFAREEENKKGMDGSQVTGACSSYARKYALNGMFCIDDTKEADTDELQTEREARIKAEEARRKAEEEARRKAEEEARRKAEEEARRKAEETKNPQGDNNKPNYGKYRDKAEQDAAKLGVRVLVDKVGTKVLNSKGAYTYLTDYNLEALNKILHTAGYEDAYDTIREIMMTKK